MKKTTIILILMFLSINIFALDLSIGGGGLVGYTFTRYTLQGGDVESKQNMDRGDLAGFFFFDATYVSLSIMYRTGTYNFRENMILDSSSLADNTGTGSESWLGFSLLGKYPIEINERLTWFPMFGVDYYIALRQWRATEGGIVYDRTGGHFMEDRDKDGKSYPLSAWNALWINIGAGLDYDLFGPFFLRSELLFGFRLPTPYEMGALEVIENMMNIKDPRLGGLTGNPALKLSFCYRF